MPDHFVNLVCFHLARFVTADITGGIFWSCLGERSGKQFTVCLKLWFVMVLSVFHIASKDGSNLCRSVCELVPHWRC